MGTAGRPEVPGTINQEGSFCFSVSVPLPFICLILFGDKPPNEAGLQDGLGTSPRLVFIHFVGRFYRKNK